MALNPSLSSISMMEEGPSGVAIAENPVESELVVRAMGRGSCLERCAR
ncbi:hypothetical protein ES332_A05G248100v1 [Gossypium tomentosum]|uniref:Uncharacterized protein n=1 Tax=Gossypium tomentosum TaxID=34277 RepID=A0A5D2QJT4_GOSTO|nr:hypothetical protein ES332_A05G248100v1 [Gossypium tomentosum]